DCLLTCAPRTVICTLSLHDALPIYRKGRSWNRDGRSGEKSPPRAVEQGKPVPRGGAGPSGEGGRGMSAAGAPLAGDGGPERGPVRPSGLLDVLGVASVVLDAEGRVVLWSPQAEELFGYTVQEALGQYAARIMVHEKPLDLFVVLVADVMRAGGSWAGAFPIRRKDGGTRLVEFRNMRLLDDQGEVFALGLAVDQSTVRRMEQDVALSTRIVAQSPIGLA